MNIAKQFERMGARVKVAQPAPTMRTVKQDNPKTGERVYKNVVASANADTFRIDIRKDKRGTFFDVLAGSGLDVNVLDVQPDDRHLLLLTKSGKTKARYLCGHDERDWFVAAIPETSPVTSVAAAKEALKPQIVQQRQERFGLKTADKSRRHTKAYIRQGEWFFVAAPTLQVPKAKILYNEPISRGRGKPHMCQELYREGGVTVYVNSAHPNGIPSVAYNRLSQDEKRGGWRMMMRDAKAYVRGKISHPDHKTIELVGWHLVEMNTENKSIALRQVAFLD